ncbi:hypothetical protein [Stratiformator vulcanicus]|uniref:Uncharacterized protein n=1 Tax=Stratiformator vulcanicus TaxID=2527980 RepID=A0A517R797_9PLAN|nr:hypothetical protein [Stratiformator vulcanicus]QDT39732.1 hypothetical protein Pan189_41410 [Stratiformator vulcanicus]
MTKMSEALKDRPKHLRSAIVRGLKAEGTAASDSGGQFGAGIIPGFAVITRSEALGHGYWIDHDFLGQVRDGFGDGVRARFTHPGLSSDGLGKKLGRVTFSEIDGDILRGDLHLSKMSHKTPDGDLAAYVVGLAEEDPELFGASIVFEVDYEAEKAHFEEHGGRIFVDDYGFETWDDSEFKSPDPLNTKNLPHARLAELRAVDIVDEPAANPSGMFHATDIPAEADALLSFALGRRDTAPELFTLSGIHPERVKGFVARYLTNHGLAVVPKEPVMPLNNTPAEPTNETPESTPAITPAEAATDVSDAGDGASESTEESGDDEGGGGDDEPAGDPEQLSGRAAALAEFRQFTVECGNESGAKWFSEGKSLEEAKSLRIAELTEQNKSLTGRLQAALAASGEAEPLSSGSAEEPKTEGTPKQQGLSEAQQKIASGIKLP